jgi:hypothetical protein
MAQSPDPDDIPAHDLTDPIPHPGLTPLTPAAAHEVDRLPSKATQRDPSVPEVIAHLTDRLARRVEVMLRGVIMGVADLAAVEMIPRQIRVIGRTTPLSPLIARERSRWI